MPLAGRMTHATTLFGTAWISYRWGSNVVFLMVNYCLGYCPEQEATLGLMQQTHMAGV